MGDFALAVLSILIFLSGLFLILLILVQRGRGGGLVGALGGGGTSSPFGSRAGDAFTRYTIILALIWIALNMVKTLAIQPPPAARQQNVVGPAGGAVPAPPVTTGAGLPATSPTGTAPLAVTAKEAQPAAVPTASGQATAPNQATPTSAGAGGNNPASTAPAPR